MVTTLYVLLALVVGSTICVYTSFMALCTAKRMYNAAKSLGMPLPWDMWAIILVLFVIGYVGDFLFNVFRGTWMFRDFPRELMFSGRIQRYMDNPAKCKKPQVALFWATVLNAGDEKHIDVGPL